MKLPTHEPPRTREGVSRWTITPCGASEIDADRDVTARQFGKGNCVRVQLCECFVLCQCLLYLSVHFPTGIARRDKKLPRPHTSVKPGKSKKFSTVLFEDCLRLLGGLDHFLRFVALEACKLYNSHDLIPPLSPMGRSRSGPQRF